MPRQGKRKRAESDEDEEYVPPVSTRTKRKKVKKPTAQKEKTPHSARGCSDDLGDLLAEGLIFVGQRCYKNIRVRGKGVVRLNLKINSNGDIALEKGNCDKVNSNLLNHMMVTHLGFSKDTNRSMYETLRFLYRKRNCEDLVIELALHEISQCKELLADYQPDLCNFSKNTKYAKQQLQKFFEGVSRGDSYIGPDPHQLAKYNFFTGTLNELPPSDFAIACARQKAEKENEFADVNRALDQWEEEYTQKHDIKENDFVHINEEKVNQVLAVPDNDEQDDDEQEEAVSATDEKLNCVLAVPDYDSEDIEQMSEEEEDEEQQRKLNQTLQIPDLFNVPVVELSVDCEAAFLEQ